MTINEIQIGAWIIWPNDIHPHPRKIIKAHGDAYLVNVLRNGKSSYKKGSNEYLRGYLCEVHNILAARLCKEEEIPEEFRIYQLEIY